MKITVRILLHNKLFKQKVAEKEDNNVPLHCFDTALKILETKISKNSKLEHNTEQHQKNENFLCFSLLRVLSVSRFTCH